MAKTSTLWCHMHLVMSLRSPLHLCHICRSWRRRRRRCQAGQMRNSECQAQRPPPPPAGEINWGDGKVQKQRMEDGNGKVETQRMEDGNGNVENQRMEDGKCRKIKVDEWGEIPAEAAGSWPEVIGGRWMLCFYTPRRILQLAVDCQWRLFKSARTSWNTSVRPRKSWITSTHKSSQDHARHLVWNIAVKKTQEILRTMC